MNQRVRLSDSGRFRLAVRKALAVGVAGTGMLAGAAMAQDAAEQERLETLEVTGSLLKRTDFETASPVTVIDRAAIETSGVATLGQLLQEMPNIAGAATNPQVNNGGGTGAATVSLRGLGSARTLLLLNGRRVVMDDVNAIPVNMIERVEVLKDGASSTYGSDAIGGVVNFITRKNFQGSEYVFGYGDSARNDAGLTNVWGTWGSVSGKSNVVLGVNYDDREKISAADREHSKVPFGLYYGEQIVFGSSRNPFGVYRVPRTLAANAGISCPGSASTVLLTRRTGQAGDDISDFRCFKGGGAENDTYNFQKANVNLTPQERYGAFLQVNSELLDGVNTFAEAFYHHTSANFQIAPEPLDSAPRGIVHSADNIYNPFGVDITDLRLRLEAVGNRVEHFDTDRFQFSTGLSGGLFDRLQWDAHVTYGREAMSTEAFGELFVPGLQDAVGPSFFAADGTPTCGTPDAPIANCIPVNFFGTPDPAALARLTPRVHDRQEQELMMYHAKIRGDILSLPAGSVGAALGAEYREESLNYQPDYLREQALISGNASSPVQGEFDVRELFGELSIPLLGGLPGVDSLVANIGLRYSDYSTFGETTNTKIGLEWRPVRELLVRGTFAEVFRAPDIEDLFGGQNESADSYVDPCNRLTTAVPAEVRDRACQNVPTNGTFQQQDTQLNALVGGNPDVQPEQGESFTLGLVYSPEWYAPLTLVADYWVFELEDTIGTAGTQNRLNQCFTNGLFCDSFQRDANGNITLLVDLVDNVGALQTDGIDFGAQLRYDNTPIGRVRFSLDTTYLISYENEQLQGAPETRVENAGRFSESSAGGDGNFPRWRANTHLDVKFGNWYALWGSRYIHSVTEDPGDFGFDPSEPCVGGVQASGAVCDRKVSSRWYHDVYGSYTFPAIRTELALGVDNVTDRTAPLIYSGFNASTDVRTYDVIGRFYYARVKFLFD